jgi:hypothetical protein
MVVKSRASFPHPSPPQEERESGGRQVAARVRSADILSAVPQACSLRSLPLGSHPNTPVYSACLRSLLTLLLALAPGLGHAQSPTPINPPLGPYVNLTPADFTNSTSFGTNDPVVLTDYFYWYDVYSKAHIIDGDGTDALTDHPATLADFSYKSKAWHRLQLTNMMDAGIDVLLAVSWGTPSERNPVSSANYWSFTGIGPLVVAREELLQEGKEPPRIGMFYDTSSLLYNSANQHIDLTTDYGREWFYESIRDFFSIIPPKHWAMVDGRPLVFLYSSSYALRYDQTCIDFTKASFARDFGGRIPYIVREVSWQVQADNVYQWGGAVGLKNPGVATLGPGYNDSAVPGRVPLIVNRENGDFYARNWTRFLQNPSKLVVVETWDEFHEGTDVADSSEYGRAYIQMTRQYSDMFRQGVRPSYPRGEYSDAKAVSNSLQATNIEAGLYQFDLADGLTAATNVAGSSCRAAITNSYGGRYIYFRVDDSFKWSTSMQLSIQVEYFDSAGGSFWIDFDGSDRNAPFQGAYSRSGLTVALTGTGNWRTVIFSLPGVRFLNSQNGGADFRIGLSTSQFFVRLVKVLRPGVPDEAGTTVIGFQDDFSSIARNTNWFGYNAFEKTFEQTNGVLRASSQPGDRNYLLLNLPAADSSTQEVLARVRVVSLGSGYVVPGGVALGVNTNDTSGLNFELTSTSAGVKAVDLYDRQLPLQPASTITWATNEWYWLRMRHQTNATATDVQAKIWRADGLTPEPPGWTTTWDYYPTYPARSGFAGITAGPGIAGFEVDYFLLKAQGLPEITVRLPPHKPAVAKLTLLPQLHTGPFALVVQGERNGTYAIETSTDLMMWDHWLSTVLTNGTAILSNSVVPGTAQKFYRARYLGNL